MLTAAPGEVGCPYGVFYLAVLLQGMILTLDVNVLTFWLKNGYIILLYYITSDLIAVQGLLVQVTYLYKCASRIYHQ